VGAAATLWGWIEQGKSAAWLRACTKVGAGPELHGRPVVVNQGRMDIGAHFHLASLPVVSHLMTGPRGELVIGDHVTIAFGAAVSCQARIRIGSGTRIAPFLVVADSDFHAVGNRHAVPEPRPVEIGRDVQIGARVTVLPGSRIGDGARVQAGSTVAGVVAAGAVVAGVPARVGGLASPGRGGTESIAERVQSIVGRALGLVTPPAIGDGPGQIPQWDSLGALRILLAMEDEFAIRLSERDIVCVRRIADLVSIVEARPAPKSA
jgi:acetyltransferase-like isoleucine patch superfamily enzyme/acyl carrier protein